jgi:hypothetical protein
MQATSLVLMKSPGLNTLIHLSDESMNEFPYAPSVNCSYTRLDVAFAFPLLYECYFDRGRNKPASQ